MVDLERLSLTQVLTFTDSGLETFVGTKPLDEVADALAAKLRQRDVNRLPFQQVTELGKSLHSVGRVEFEPMLSRTARRLTAKSGISFDVNAWPDAPPLSTGWGGDHHLYQISKVAQGFSYRPNYDRPHFWFGGTLAYRPEENPRDEKKLTIVFSLHHMGREPTGIMAATSCAYAMATRNEPFDASDEIGGVHGELAEIKCMSRPFTFTWQNTVDEVKPSLLAWLNECLAIALKEWGDRL